MEDAAQALTGAWQGMLKLLRGLIDALPAAIHTLKFARREVTNLASNLDTIFDTFEVKGPAMFDGIAGAYRGFWIAYFCGIVVLNSLVLYYAFWAGGYLGGPQPIPQEQDAPSRSRTFRENCCLCLSGIGGGLQKCHDTPLCFWSMTLFMQVLVLVIFIAAIACCILSGVKAFVLAGCGEVYILGDISICSDALVTVRNFLDTFYVSSESMPLSAVCEANSLLTCRMISEKMKSSGLLTTLFSLLAAVFSFQLLVDSASLYEQAKWRRQAHALYLKEAQGAAPLAGEETTAAASS